MCRVNAPYGVTWPDDRRERDSSKFDVPIFSVYFVNASRVIGNMKKKIFAIVFAVQKTKEMGKCYLNMRKILI